MANLLLQGLQRFAEAFICTFHNNIIVIYIIFERLTLLSVHMICSHPEADGLVHAEHGAALWAVVDTVLQVTHQTRHPGQRPAPGYSGVSTLW